jgi:succinate dehydrogenase/fumarate reductase iron-sulfur protein
VSIQVPVRLFRYRPGTAPRLAPYVVTVPDGAHVIDVIQAVWAEHDRTLMFRHACHHASCGTCAVRLNGYECLPCIVPVQTALRGRRELVIEPLRNFPLVGDLVVDMARFFDRQARSNAPATRPVEPAPAGGLPAAGELLDAGGALAGGPNRRFETCIECGICLSACPTMAADADFLGPAALMGVQRVLACAPSAADAAGVARLADTDQGAWRCHSAFECAEACPQCANPAGAIMALRRALVVRKLRTLVGREA